MRLDSRNASLTPRTDAAERFFHEPGRQPVGFVASGVARVLEVELARALAQLKIHGVEAPPPLDVRTHALLHSARKPTASIFTAPARSPERNAPVTAVVPAQPKALPARLLDENHGEARSYDDGAVLYRAGERAEHVFVLLYGQLRVSQRQDGGAERVAGPGHVFAEQGLFEEGVHTESLNAVGQARCLLLPIARLRSLLTADPSLLSPVLLCLVLQYRMALEISERLAAGVVPSRHELLGQKTLTGPELLRALAEARVGTGQEPLTASQQMCLKLQTIDLMPTRLLRAGMSLGRPGEEHLGLGAMLVNGRAQVRIGEHLVQLGQGSVVGVAEGLTGQAFGWHFSAMQDINARVFPIDRALQRLERADPTLRALAGHLCASILGVQGVMAG